MIASIEFEKCRDFLVSLYSPKHRGRPPKDPVKMLKSIFLMMEEGFTSFDKWVIATRTNPGYAEQIGFSLDEMPGVGTYYDFLNRLVDGPYQPSCPHRVKPSSLEKGLHQRNLKAEKDKNKMEEDGRSKTVKLSDELLRTQALPNPTDLQSRLQTILNSLAIEASINRGLLEPENLVVSGDGSCLESGANPRGKPTCDCRKRGIYNCSCDRLYSDKTADWGYDSYRETFFFGHRFYQIIASTSGHDLPLSVSIAPASSTDFTMSLETFDRFLKSVQYLGIKISKCSLDAGHDAIGVYNYFDAQNIFVAIPLNNRGKSEVPKKHLSPNGIPLCPGGLEMRFFARDKKRRRQLFNCPVKRNTHRKGKYLYVSHVDECPLGRLCQENTSLGPVAFVAEKENLRLFPVIRRNSAEFKRLMNLRTGVERSNSVKKVAYKLAENRTRRASITFIRLYIISILEHAKAWELEDLKNQAKKQWSILPKVA